MTTESRGPGSGSISLPDRLERIEDKLDENLRTLLDLQVQIAVLKTKMIFWGSGAAVIVSAVVSKLVGG